MMGSSECASEIRHQYKHIRFVLIDKKPKTSVWSCRNRHGQSLGLVKWYGPWRQYCYFANTDAVYSRSCLADMAAFLKEVSDHHAMARRVWM